jgi:hypothetical protein
MAAKRLSQKAPGPVRRLAGQLEPIDDEPLRLTCPGCGVKVEHTAYSCPQCGVLFYERQHGRVPRLPDDGPHETDPAITEFARRMDHLEKWTRRLCVGAGVLFLLLAALSLWGMVSGPMGGRTGLYGLLLFGLLAAVCLARGLKGEGAELSLLDKLPSWRSFRGR